MDYCISMYMRGCSFFIVMSNTDLYVPMIVCDVNSLCSACVCEQQCVALGFRWCWSGWERMSSCV